MDLEKRKDIALFRYGVIAPLITGMDDSAKSVADYCSKVSAKGVPGPNGEIEYYAPQTIEKWHQSYMKNSFDGLMPKGRNDAGLSRKINEEVDGAIRKIASEYPKLSAAGVYRKLKEDGIIKDKELSESSVLRFMNRLKEEKDSTALHKDMRRYERLHINEVWCGDSTVGPKIKDANGNKHIVYIIALIDDASRMIVGIEAFYNDNYVNLLCVIKSAVSTHGVPAIFNFDNGKSYRNKQMDLLSARIGSVIHYCRPYTPVQKAKIERWFYTLKSHWMAALDVSKSYTLNEINLSLREYVHKYNMTVHSSLNNMSPFERYFSESEFIRRIPEENIDKDFLLEQERRVSADCVVKLDNVEYEVDCRFAKRLVKIRYTGDKKNIYVVENENLIPIRKLNKHENAVSKRYQFRLSEGSDE